MLGAILAVDDNILLVSLTLATTNLPVLWPEIVVDTVMTSTDGASSVSVCLYWFVAYKRSLCDYVNVTVVRLHLWYFFRNSFSACCHRVFLLLCAFLCKTRSNYLGTYTFSLLSVSPLSPLFPFLCSFLMCSTGLKFEIFNFQNIEKYSNRLTAVRQPKFRGLAQRLWQQLPTMNIITVN